MKQALRAPSQNRFGPTAHPAAQLITDQRLAATAQLQRAQLLANSAHTAAQRKIQDAMATSPANRTGLPDTLKSGVEQLSGVSLDDVRVHYDSAEPAKMQAHAYAQGSDIHLAPGQQRHLAHEAWHVAQQKQGRVQATTQTGGVNINDDQSLEQEADIKGTQAAQRVSQASRHAPTSTQGYTTIVQRVPWSREPGGLDGQQTNVDWKTASVGGDTVGVEMEAHFLGPDHVQGGPPKSGAQKTLMAQLPTDPSQSNPNKYIRGHLLNDNLGGAGEDYNLFPITGNANKEHEAVIESKVKDWVNVRKQWVYYKVAVSYDASQLTSGIVNAKLACEAYVLDPAQAFKRVNGIAATINSQYSVAHSTDRTNAVGNGLTAAVGAQAGPYVPLESLSKNDREYRLTDKLFGLLQGYSKHYPPEKIIRGFEKLAGIGEGLVAAFVDFANDALKYGNQPQALAPKEKANLTRINSKENEIDANFARYVDQELSNELLNKWHF